MQTILSLIVFLLILGVLVFIHELGHFLVAKWTGMRVDEFAVGFPPRIFGVKRGETTYALNALPFGGYVKIHGENPEETDEDPRSFDKRPVWARLLVMLAGITMNVLFAFVVLVIAFSIGFSSISQDLTQVPGSTVIKHDVLVTEVEVGSPANQAGLEPGDYVRDFITPDGHVQQISSVNQLQAYTKQLQAAHITSVKIEYTREGNNGTLTSKIDQTGLALGIGIESEDTVRVPVWEAPKVAYNESVAILGLTWDALKNFGIELFGHAKLDPNVSGPIGIYEATNTATKMGFAEVVYLAVLLSLNLALLNLVPVPALDGGRVLFLIIEGVFRKRVIQREIEGILTTVSFFLLILLMVALTARDILHLI